MIINCRLQHQSGWKNKLKSRSQTALNRNSRNICSLSCKTSLAVVWVIFIFFTLYICRANVNYELFREPSSWTFIVEDHPCCERPNALEEWLRIFLMIRPFILLSAMIKRSSFGLRNPEIDFKTVVGLVLRVFLKKSRAGLNTIRTPPQWRTRNLIEK